MALKVISLTDLIRTQTEESITELLYSFSTINSDSSGAVDVENFIHTKAISFEKMSLSRTYLIIATYKKRPYLAGYFSISNRPLIIPKKHFQRMTTTLQKRLMGIGHRTYQQTYEIKGYLLGQLGKNYCDLAIKAKGINGTDILALAYEKVLEAHRIVGGRILYLECEDNDKIKKFYTTNGFRELPEYKSDNGYCIMVKKIEDI
jgi:hypothetical protein